VVPPPPPPPPAPVTLYNVRIGATPWAYFTVDDDKTQHQTIDTVKLPAGKHRLHLWNPPLALDKTITIEVAGDMQIVEKLQ